MMLPEKLRFHVLYSKHVSVSCFYLETVLPIGSGKQIRFSFAFLYLCSLFPQMKNAGKPWHCCVVRLWLQAQRGPGPVAAGAAWRCSAIMSRLAGSGTTGNWSSKIFPSSLHAIYMFIMEVFKALMTRNAHCGERMIEAEPGDCSSEEGMLITSKEAGGQHSCCLPPGDGFCPCPPILAQMCSPTLSRPQ